MQFLRFAPLLCLLLVVPLIRAQGDDPKTKKGLPMVDGLKALKHADPKVRYRAAQTLGDLGPLAKFAVPELRETLQDKHPMVRIKAAEALWKIEQTPGAILMPILLEALKHKEPSVRAAAPRVIALLGTKAKNALPALEEALQDKDFDVKVAAITALGDLGPIAKEQAGALLDLAKDKEFFLLEPFVGAALSNLGDGAIPTLKKALSDKSLERRRLAAYSLGSMGPKAAPAALELAKVLQNDDSALRTLAARALGKIGADAKATIPELEKSLDDKVAAVRIEAALATWFITGQATHIAVLAKELKDKSPSVRENACQAIAVMKAGAKDAVEPVAKLLTDKELRLRAIITLGEIGPPAEKTLPNLKAFLKDKDGDVQLWSAFAVWQITGETKESMKVLEELLGTEKHYTPTIRILGEMGPAAQSMLPTLVRLYREEDVPEDRLALAVAIKKIDPKAATTLGIK
jgi:HEAT repeat protein